MALISFAVTAKLICAFVFAYADCWFSHAAAHLIFKGNFVLVSVIDFSVVYVFSASAHFHIEH